MLFCQEAIFVANLRTFWRTFYRLKKCSGVPKMTNMRYVPAVWALVRLLGGLLWEHTMENSKLRSVTDREHNCLFMLRCWQKTTCGDENHRDGDEGEKLSWSAGLRILKQVPDGSPDLDSTNCQPDIKYLFLTWLTRLPPKFSSLSLSACATVSFVDAKVFRGSPATFPAGSPPPSPAWHSPYWERSWENKADIKTYEIQNLN